ncbi:MAG TPA: HTH domain-containing protein, partial [Candidatus Jeotgalibaca pullicola]|nr:HTH domain-containing protein [Candidatus Jeotgalibaca pullicola]
MINKRLLHIIRILLKQNTYVTIAELSNELNVSYKTIANDLKMVEAWLTEHGLELIKKTGVGVNIEGSNEIKLSVYQFISRKSKENIDYSPKARMIYIGMKLLLESTCRVHELADDLFVSRATVHKDIHSLTAIFESYKIELLRKNNNGITISGSEKNFRNCLIELMKIDNGYHVFYEMVKNTNYPCDGSFPFLGLDVNDDEFVEFLKVLENINSKYLHTLLFDSLVQVLHHLFVSFVRIKENHLIHLSESFLQELKFKPYYDDVYEICKAIENYYSIQYSEMEIRYLQVFFLSLKNTNEIRTDDRVDAQEITTSLINEWEKM